MNRQILFRGKRLDNGEWAFGIPIKTHIGTYMITEENPHICSEYGYMEIDEFVKVEPGSVGQFVGLKDKNGKEIYEGDIILYGNTIKNVVVFRHGAFGYLVYGGEFISYAGNTNFTFNPLDRSKEHEVIGNIFDNPDLLNGK